MPIKFGPLKKIDYGTQDYVFELTRALRKMVRTKAGLPARPPIVAGVVKRAFSRLEPGICDLGFPRKSEIAFDDLANYAGWDVRDPRGRSARVFAPGSRKRIRREKEWHERIDNQRKLLTALAGVGTLAGAGVGALIGRRFPRITKPIVKPRTVIEGPWFGKKA